MRSNALCCTSGMPFQFLSNGIIGTTGQILRVDLFGKHFISSLFCVHVFTYFSIECATVFSPTIVSTTSEWHHYINSLIGLYSIVNCSFHAHRSSSLWYLSIVGCRSRSNRRVHTAMHQSYAYRVYGFNIFAR